MKNEIFKLLHKYNKPEKGLFINMELSKYISKIYENAVILTYHDKELKAFIAFYANDITLENAYLTLILVDKSMQGQSVGKRLLSSSIEILKNRGFKHYHLEVLKSNDKAIRFYEALDFKIKGDNNQFFEMTKQL